MINAKEMYEKWLDSGVLSDIEKNELLEIKDNDKEIEDRFWRDLEFGTGGMRGIIGMGINRMNIYTVRRATQGLVKYLKDANAQGGVVIGYDTRFFSDTFARETAKVLVANGIKAYLFDCVHATPEVSFAIRYYEASAGVMITASHNPKEYNGYKAYGSDGAQFPPEASDIIIEAVNSYDVFGDVKAASEDEFENSPLLCMIGKEVDEAFLTAVQKQSIDPEVIRSVADTFKLVYTPFHGTGLRPVTEILKRIGVKNFVVEPKQAVADGAFPTVKSPNPEDKEGFTDAIALAKDYGASLIIGTDPDADRVGVVIRDSEGEYKTLTGNQIGALLCQYILTAKKKAGTLSPKSTVIKTIVSSCAADAICADFGCQVMDVLTGFKYIAEKIAGFEANGNGEYAFGFEESYGYLVGTYARDKDAVGAVMLIAEMAAAYSKQGKTLYDALIELYEKYGYFTEKTVSISMPGKDGMEKIASTMTSVRENMPKELGGIKVKISEDYLKQIKITEGNEEALTGFAKSNVLRFKLADDKTFVAIRPSGTEPKMKLYVCTCADTMQEAESQLDYMVGAIKSYLAL